ncbi:hypothetical protein NQ315_000729 [Exocentrus adspersus]|uniref:Uncharacterized protein n=1 Tax=Exocentrus adspersus TaxID=1586481 RepID=A0AAV8WD09_9CUCU|nr:hypothetical protein NQ315_000729 [Exocentrus adspersus]
MEVWRLRENKFGKRKKYVRDDINCSTLWKYKEKSSGVIAAANLGITSPADSRSSSSCSASTSSSFDSAAETPPKSVS